MALSADGNPANCVTPAPLRYVSVLIVDDERDTADLLADLLRSHGYTACTASNGQEALELLATIQPGVILLDIQMPVMDGAEFREAQRRDRRLLEIPTAVMTGSDAEMQLDLAVEETLRKPVRQPELLAFVSRHCQHDLARDKPHDGQ